MRPADPKHVAQAIPGFELQLIVLQQRVGLDEDVRHRVLIVPVAGHRQLAGHHTPTEPGVAFEHHHFFSGHGEIGCRDQAVVAHPTVTTSNDSGTDPPCWAAAQIRTLARATVPV